VTAARAWPVALRLAVLAALALLVWRFAGAIDWRLIGSTIAGARWAPLALATAGNALLVALKARRARTLLLPVRAVPWTRLANIYLASYAADNLLLSQAGPAARILLIHRAGVPLVAAAGEQALEKLLEGATLLALLPLAPRALASVRWPGGGLATAGILVGAAAIVVVAVLLVRSPRLRPALASAVGLGRPLVAAEVLALSLLHWAVEVAMVALTLSALGLPSTVQLSALVVIAVNLAALQPGLPGNVGTFEAAAGFALTSAGIAPGAALACALVFHALHTVPVTIAGLPGLRSVLRLKRRAPAA
jgi:uncharacterized membrane protein YbhN (UPF0104 family)